MKYCYHTIFNIIVIILHDKIFIKNNYLLTDKYNRFSDKYNRFSFFKNISVH